MKFAINYSEPAAQLQATSTIQADYFKCPAWPDVVKKAHQQLPSYVHLPLIVGQGDGRVKTATFLLEDARLSNGLDHGADFRLICDGPNDLVVRWVRVLRTPAAMPSRGEG